MYLKSLEMLGFKSFAEAKIQFPKGITAIVGPNGSGKSNVVDSILWVLGEQSTKTLRSEKMEDVIFNGTELRKPLGLVEVSLVIGGLGELRLDAISGLPSELSEYQELMITRRLYRNGDSEYLINKTPCRLKDIRNVLIETRAGSKGHTVIEQGRIEQILQASPQDRRELIEETAGIVRYKKQKAEALRKLESTQQNLLRVRDIVAEVKKQLNSLERQARQARTYQTLQQEAKGLEIELLSRDYRTMHADLEAVDHEARAKLGAARLEEGRLDRPPISRRRQDREDRADGDVGVDVGGAVERVDGHHHPPGAVEYLRRGALLGNQRRDPGLAERLHEPLVGEKVERLLRVAVAIGLAHGSPERAFERPATDDRRQRHGGFGDGADHAGDLGTGMPVQEVSQIRTDALGGRHRCFLTVFRLAGGSCFKGSMEK